MKEKGLSANLAEMPRKRYPSRSTPLNYLHVTIGLLFAAGAALALILIGVYFYLSLGLPSISKLINYEPPAVTEVLDWRGETLAYWYKERRFPVPISQMPHYLIQAFVAAEDARFYEHRGIDFWGILRAALKDIKARRIVQGGSTITQQVARALLLSPERSFVRKLKEAILAWEIDSSLTKDEILTIYLNHIYLGAGAYGVEAAARTYFSKHVWELTLPEAALIAGLTPAPSRYNPLRNPDLALKRRAYVLRRMAEEGYISWEEAEKAIKSPLNLRPYDFSPKVEAGYFLDYLRERLEKRLGQGLYTAGYTIYTTLDLTWQREALKALNQKLKEIARRHRQKEIPQGAVVCLDHRHGGIRVLVGGRDYRKSQFNRAVQARRQPGSAFKPIIWATVLEEGLASVSSRVVDEPVVLPGAKPGTYWQPKNFDRGYLGAISLRTALVHSRNTVAVKLARAVGLPDLLETAKAFGIKTPLKRNYSLALGSGGLSLLEVARAYTVFANQGKLLPLRVVETIFDRYGESFSQEEEPPRPVLSPETSFLMVYLLEEVVRDGTGRCAQRLGVPVGGKTGTTDNYQDAWFVGFSREVTCGVWVGYDEMKPLGRGETGGRAACPLWVSVMESYPEGFSGKDFEAPEGIVWAQLKDFDPLRGEETLWMPFREGEIPELKTSLPRSRWPRFIRELLRPRFFW